MYEPSPEAAARIGDSAIRIILLKVAVGKERPVYKKYSDYLNSLLSQGDLIDWWAYKIFGEYDLCFIIRRHNFNHDMAFAGTIEGITYSTELLCYKWEKLSGTPHLFHKESFKNPLVCISILKVKPPLLKMQDENFEVESALTRILATDSNIFCLGSFGWGEFVFLYPSDTFTQIYKFVRDLNEYGYDDSKQDMTGLFLKSFSLLGVNYDIIHPTLKCKEFIKEEISTKRGFYPSLLISSRPSEISTLHDILSQTFGRHSIWQAALQRLSSKQMSTLIFGPYDISFVIRGGTWGQFIDNLITFRETHGESIFKTLVQINCVNEHLPQFKKAWTYRPKAISIDSGAASHLQALGSPSQETILSTIYTFNQYIQNELISDSIEDMIPYLIEMVLLALQDHYQPLQTEAIQKRLVYLPENIKFGCNQRLGGYLLQEGAEDFSPFKGGKHRITKALKALAHDIFEIMNFQWRGFVVIGRRYEYNNLAGILSIPVDAAFFVDEYFGLFHESAHVYLNYIKNADLAEEDVELFAKGGQRDLFEKVESLRREVFCDLFDYQCGFLGKLDLYTFKLIPYLSRFINRHRAPYELEEYAARFLCVLIYAKKSQGSCVTEISHDVISRLANDALDMFGAAINNFSSLVDSRSAITENLIDIATRMLKVIRQFEERYQELWSRSVDERLRKLEENSFKAQFSAIVDGNIVSDIEHPQLVVLAMIDSIKNGESIPFNAHVAAIQSFLKVYYQRNWDSIRHLYEKEDETS